jgi:hypothetical protein
MNERTECLATVLVHELQEVDRPAKVVLVVQQWYLNRFSNSLTQSMSRAILDKQTAHLEASKVNARLEGRVLPEHLFQSIVVAQIDLRVR